MVKHDLNWGKMIRQLRRDRNLVQAEVAKAVGVSQMTVSRWESGRAVPVRPERVTKKIRAMRPVVMEGA